MTISNEEKDVLREHDFDGIKEYDNDLPRWWVWLFWVTIIFSIAYPFYYDFGPGQFATETVDAQVMEHRRRLEASSGSSASDEGSLLKLASNPSVLTQGRELYAPRCSPCHLEAGQGLIGPNLTDDYWIHGGKITDVHHIVVEGVVDKGMVPWKGQLTAEQINAVVAFVWSLHGSNPPNPKEPQGVLVPR